MVRGSVSNPWIRKYLFLSMWLRDANKAAGIERGPVVAETDKQRASVTLDAFRIWSGAWFPASKSSPKRKR